MKKLLLISLWVMTLFWINSINATSYPEELVDAYNRAYEKWIITESPIDNANLYNSVTNLELANIMNKFSENVLWLEPNTSKSCIFDDILDLTEQEQNIVKKSCQLWLMPWDMDDTLFKPNDTSKRAIFGTALSRTLWWSKYEWWEPYYQKHLEALKDAWIMNQIDNAENRNEIKWYILSTLKNSINNELNNDNCETINLTYTISSDIITLKWKNTWWDKLNISILNPDNNEYTDLWTANINDWSFSYEIMWQWEQNLLIRNKCNEEYKYKITTNSNTWVTPSEKNNDFTDFQWIITKTSENWILLKAKNTILWEFLIKPKNNTLNLNNITLRNWDDFSCKDISILIDNEKVNNCTSKWPDLSYKFDKTANLEWINVKIILNEEHKWTYMIWLLAINGYYNYEEWLPIPIEFFTKRYENALVYIKNQVNYWNRTEYTLWIKKSDKNTSIYNVWLFNSVDCVGSPLNTEHKKSIGEWWSEYINWKIIEAINSESTQNINSISYVIDKNELICLSRNEFLNYFIVNWEERKVYPFSTEVVSQKDYKEKEITNEVSENWYTNEMNEAYKFAYKNWITTINDINKAKMNSPLTRIAMSKMLSNYAINVLWKKPDTTKWNIKFNDVSDTLNKQYNNAVTLSYQLWIMWQNMKNNNFRPYDEVTRAEFTTALSRMLYSTTDWNPYYTTHLKKLKDEWIITNDNPMIKEKRWYVMLMLMRTSN